MTSAQYSSIAAAGAVTGAAVVVDVMRAFTTAAWALHLGVDRVVLAGDPDHALYLKRFFPGAVACADGAPRDGFELVNSPAKVAQHDLAGRVLVQCTTNGTAGVLAAWRAQPLYCASFVVARATARALSAARSAAVTFVITGDGGHAEEDRACAEYISTLIDDPSTDADSYCERASGAASATDLRRGVELGYEGVDVEDVDYCLDADRFDFALLAVPDLDTISIRRVPAGFEQRSDELGDQPGS